MSSVITARVLSLVGHPALLMPATFLFSVAGNDASALTLQTVVVGSVFVGGSTIAYSWRQVREGRWSHVDASLPHERSQINLFLMALFFGAAALMVALDQPQPLVLSSALSGALVALGHLLRPWLKMSLHVSFAVFAASFLWPSMVGTLVILILAIAISWSRLALARHTWQEVIIALLAGAVTGTVFNLATGIGGACLSST